MKNIHLIFVKSHTTLQILSIFTLNTKNLARAEQYLNGMGIKNSPLFS
jgi:hypothetical protein